MLCKSCGSTNDDGSNFCSKCGEDLRTFKADEISAASESLEEHERADSVTTEHSETADAAGDSPEAEDMDIAEADEHIIPHETEEEEAEPLNITAVKKPLSRIIMTFLAGLTFVMFALSAFLYIDSDISTPAAPVYKSTGAPDETEQASVVVENIIIPEKEIVLQEGQQKQIHAQIYPIGAERDLFWSTDGDGVRVNETGKITAVTPGFSGQLKVVENNSKKEAVVNVRVLTKDAAFFETIEWINSKDKEQKINLFEKNFVPSKPNPELQESESSADRRIQAVEAFDKINGELSSYNVVQKKLTNALTGNLMDCDIYKEATTGDIRKIVTIEYKEDSLNITDYYYLSGKIAFIFNREENYYRPVAANLGIPGFRLYFDNDALVTYRTTEATAPGFTKTDYSIGKNGLEWDVVTYEFDYESSTVLGEEETLAQTGIGSRQSDNMAKYSDMEASYINAAYNLYNRLCEIPETSMIFGHAIDANGNALKGINVKVFSEEYKILISQSVTDDSGLYSVEAPCSDEPYTIILSAPNYSPTTIYGVRSKSELASSFQEPVHMIPSGLGIVEVQLSVVNAQTGERVNTADASTILKLRPGINNRTGAALGEYNLLEYYRGENDHLGQITSYYAIPLMAGNYTGELITGGHESTFFTVSATTTNRVVQSNIIPEIQGDEVKIVLSWQNTPSDLDSHVFYPGDEHIAYYSMTNGGDSLDLDCTTGYGPETITLNSPSDGIYKYYVADYTNCSLGQYSSKQMSDSGACVQVYTKDGLTNTFYVPKNQEGVIWHVFNLANGRVVPVQRYFNNVQDMDWWSAEKSEN